MQVFIAMILYMGLVRMPNYEMYWSKWQSTYNMDREMSVDETLILFKGRTKLLNYIPSKPHQWGGQGVGLGKLQYYICV